MEQCQEDAPKDASEKEILIAGAIPIAAAILVTGFLHRAQLRNMLDNHHGGSSQNCSGR
jgi:hypothetical protein